MKTRNEGKMEGKEEERKGGRKGMERKRKERKRKQRDLFPPRDRCLYISTKDTRKGGASICGESRRYTEFKGKLTPCEHCFKTSGLNVSLHVTMLNMYKARDFISSSQKESKEEKEKEEEEEE